MALTVHSFEIQGQPVDLADLGVEPVALTARFGDGATLTLNQTRDHHKAALQPNTTVAYKADGVYRFIGQVRSVARRTQDDGITFVALDALAMAASSSVNINTSLYADDIVNAALADAGLTAGDSIDLLTARTSMTMPWSGTLEQCLRDAMAADPTYRLVVDPSSGSPVVEAVKVYSSGNVQTLRWGGDVDRTDPQPDLLGRVIDLSIQESVDGCFTAVLLVQPDYKSGSATYDKEVSLTKAWPDANESTWSISKAGVATATGMDFGSDPSEKDIATYRAWQVPFTTTDFDPEQPWRLMIAAPADYRHSLTAIVWYPIDAEMMELNEALTLSVTPDASPTAVSRRFILAKHPVTVKGNVRDPGKAVGPTGAKLIYQATRGGGAVPSYVRVPGGSAFEGTAYTRYGVQAVKRIEVSDNGYVTPHNAQLALDSLKDVRHTGLVEVYGAMPAWAWAGGASVKISGYSEKGTPVFTDYGAIEFTQTGWSVNFRADTYAVELTDSRAEFVNLGALS